MLDKASVSPQSLEWAKGEYAKTPTGLQELAAKVLEGRTLTKPIVIFFHHPADASAKSSPLDTLTSGKDLSLGIALHNAFEVFSVEVPPATSLAGKAAPLVIIADANGKILSEAGGKGASLPASALNTALAAASKILGYDIKSRVTRATTLIQGMITLEGQIKAQQDLIAKAVKPEEKANLENKIAALEKRKADMVEQEKTLWSDLPTTKPEALSKAAKSG